MSEPVGGDGLTLQQRRVLVALIAGKSIKEACEAESLNQRTFTHWLSNPAFREAYDQLFDNSYRESLKRTLEGAASSAVDVYEDAIANASKRIKVSLICPHCGKGVSEWVQVEDWKARLHAADTLLKISDILVQRQEVKGKIEHEVTVLPLTFDLQMALMAHKAGRPIPPNIEQRLIEMGHIQPRLPAHVDAEFREVSREDPDA